MHPTLQMLKAHGLSPNAECDDLAVEDDRPIEQDAQGPEPFGYVGKLRGLVIAEPRPETHGWSVEFGGFSRNPPYGASKADRRGVRPGAATCPP